MSQSEVLLPLLLEIGYMCLINSLYYMHAHVSVRAAMYMYVHMNYYSVHCKWYTYVTGQSTV